MREWGYEQEAKQIFPGVQERAARLVRDHRDEPPSFWAAVESSTGMIRYTPQTLYEVGKRDAIDRDEHAGGAADERERLKALERENKELRRANDS